MQTFKEKLEKLYNSFDFDKAVKNDPIKFPKRFSNPLDIEISSLISSSFAYGNIKCFCSFLEELFRIMGENPSDFILNFNPAKLIKELNIRYRFSSINDIVAFLYVIQFLLKKNSSLQVLFLNQQALTEKHFASYPIISGISNFVKEALKADLSLIYGKDVKPRGLLHFFPNPKKGSPCKRINLFLRWMVRNSDIDFGLWNTIKPSQLIIPLDTHIFNVSKKLEITQRNTQTLKTAIDITEFFKKINPEDPLKYDFVLCHNHMEKIILLE